MTDMSRSNHYRYNHATRKLVKFWFRRICFGRLDDLHVLVLDLKHLADSLIVQVISIIITFAACIRAQKLRDHIQRFMAFGNSVACTTHIRDD